MGLAVGFRVVVPGGDLVGEDALDGHPELRGREPLEGAVVLTVDGSEIVIEDELEALAHRVCADAVTQLAAERNVAVPYFDKPGYVRMDPEGWRVRLSGDYLPEALLPRLELVDGLLRCGDRIVAFLRGLGTHDGQANTIAAAVERAREAAAAGAQTWPGLPPRS